MSNELMSILQMEGEEAGGGALQQSKSLSRCLGRRLKERLASWLQLLKEQAEVSINVATISAVIFFNNNSKIQNT